MHAIAGTSSSPGLESAAFDPAGPDCRRLTVYTALVGPKEPLGDPLADLPEGATTDLDLDFVCITDDPKLRSDVWRMQLLPTRHLPPEKLSRRPKALPHEYFPDTDHSLYIDNTISFRRLPQASDLQTERPYLFRAYRHATRSTLEEEAGVIATLGFDEVSTICTQLDFIAARTPPASLSPLTTATVLLRSHHAEAVRRFGVLWWESVLAFSKRDQLSFDFALQQAGAAVEYFPGITKLNEFVQWHCALGRHRVKASFDAQRYAWLHRDDPEAQCDPKAHFLAHAQGSGHAGRYERRPPMLEYWCFQGKSSLGSQYSPRRQMAGALEALLLPFTLKPCRYLMVRVQGDPSARRFEADELATASASLANFLGDGGAALDLSAADLRSHQKVYTAQTNPYDLIVVIGLSGEHLGAAVQKLARLANPAQGALIAALCSPAPVQEAARTEALLEGIFGTPAHTALQGSRHDDQFEVLDNTVVGFSWPRVAVSEPAEAVLATEAAERT